MQQFLYFRIMPEGDVRENYERGKDLFERGQYIEAEEFLKLVLKENPFYADVHNKLGLIAGYRGDLQDAVHHFEEAVKLNPGYTEASLNLSITYNELGRHDMAAGVMERASTVTQNQAGRLDPFIAGKIANEHFKVGNLYLEFHLIEDAVEEFSKALKLRPGLADIETRLARALMELGRLEEAAGHFEAAKRTNPYFGPARVYLGLLFLKQGKKELAVKEWEEALQKNPDLKEAACFLRTVRDQA